MRLSLTALILFVVTAVSPVAAGNITVRAEGILTEYFDPDQLLPFPEPAAGSVFRLTFSYDDATERSTIAGNPEGIAIYSNAFLSFQFDIAGTTYAPLESGSIRIFDDFAGDGIFFDQWRASTQTSTVGDTATRFEDVGLSLIEQSATAPIGVLDSLDLVVPFGPEPWDTAQISYAIFEAGPGVGETLAAARATITSLTLVPIPAAVWLFSSALLLLGRLGRRASH